MSRFKKMAEFGIFPNNATYLTMEQIREKANYCIFKNKIYELGSWTRAITNRHVHLVIGAKRHPLMSLSRVGNTNTFRHHYDAYPYVFNTLESAVQALSISYKEAVMTHEKIKKQYETNTRTFGALRQEALEYIEKYPEEFV